MNNLLKRQEQLFEAIARSELGKQFYFGGGSALALFDLKHRVSLDLDFFTQEPISQETLEYAKNIIIQTFPHTSISYIRHYDRYIFTCRFTDNTCLEVEFVQYPAKRIYPAEQKIGEMEIAHHQDIFLDKLVALAMRDEIKDFVDLVAYIEKHGVVWNKVIKLAEQKHGIAGLEHILVRKFNTPPFDEKAYKSLRFNKPVELIINLLKSYAEEIVHEMVRQIEGRE
ncbi:MAG: nucleotidyl transferase AbiEii/AbiGii toxin family protein [bacterium]|nr:nucleotidyl transferase AbiEii/AbiGii toxin family protein [bacterium]